MLKKFNDWAATWWPGLKTKTLAWLVGLPSATLAVLESLQYVGVDWTLFIGKTAPYVGLGTALAIYWLRIITNREIT